MIIESIVKIYKKNLMNQRKISNLPFKYLLKKVLL